MAPCIDTGYPTDVIYLDFSKAFDKVPHKRLLLKIRSLGIGEKISDWLEDWLTDRRQRVVVRGCESDWLPVKSGVPQGSVMGPILFLIINDIEEDVMSKVLKFSDDTKIYRSVSTMEDVQELQKDLRRLYQWSLEWQMLFNVEKCKCLHFGVNNRNHQYTLGDQGIENVTAEKDLGVIVKENLDVSDQVAEKVKTANKVLGMINRIYDDKSQHNIISLYKSLVRPHLEYAIQAWRPYKQKDIDAIEKVQRRATRMIEGMQNVDYGERLRRTNLISLEMRRLRADLIEVFKIVNGLEGLRAEDFFETLRIGSTRGLSIA